MTSAEADTSERTQVIEGRFEPGPPDWVYLPVKAPVGVREIAVRYSYDRPAPPPGVPGNALDIGVFDQIGHDLGNAAGFRGWSGGARDSFAISQTAATPGYVPGPIGAGTWHVLLGPYTVHPDGLDYRVEVTLRFGSPGPEFVPRPAPARAVGRGRAWYRGDMHMHTVHSDGQWSPRDLVDAAKAAGLDFMVSTEHNTPTAAGIWGHHARDDLLIVDGEEVTTRNGHLVAAGLPAGTWLDWRYRASDGALPGVLDAIHDVGALAIAAHPFCPFVGCAWRFGFDGLDAVEVWNGPWTADDEIALRQWDAALVSGRPASRSGWLPAVGNSDSHHAGQPVGLPQNVVAADDLTRDAILAGVRAGRCYLTESSAVSVDFSALGGERRAGIGDRLDAEPDTPVTVDLTVRGVPGGTVLLITDEGQLAAFTLPDELETTLLWTTSPQAARYVRAEIRRPVPTPLTPDTMAALTNPIFLG